MISIKDLKEAELFKGLNSKQLQSLSKHLIEEDFQIGQVVFSQGTPAEKLYVLLDGQVSLGIKARGEVDITAYSVNKKGKRSDSLL